jgi:hypothetical protein
VVGSGQRRGRLQPPSPLTSASTPTRPALAAGHSLMQVEICLITPEKAAELLLKNTTNRPLRRTHVNFFENQLRRGEMQLTHQGIAISASGRLLDGQHRLTAIVNTGISATLVVASNLPDSAFTVLDTGIARQASDVLSIEGVQNASGIAAGVRLFLYYTECPGLIWSGSNLKIASHTRIRQEFISDADRWKWAAQTAQSHALARVISPGPTAAFLYLAIARAGYSKEYLCDFLRQVKEGVELKYGNPILAYRNRSYNGLTDRRVQQARLADFIKLFNAYATGQSLKQFKSQSIPPMPTLVNAEESIHEKASA